MLRRTIGLALIVVLGGLVTGQAAPPQAHAVVVTNDYTRHLQAWRPGAAGYERVWEATPRAADAQFATRRAEAIIVPRDAPLVVADYDSDGSADLLVMDAYGITVYGVTPAYYPFDTVNSSTFVQRLAAADVDGDGQVELVTQRATDKGRAIEIWKRAGGGLQAVQRKDLDGSAYVLHAADLDQDGRAELITGSDALVVLMQAAGGSWDTVAEMPNLGMLDAVRVADVDRDGKPEVVAASMGGRVTVYKVRRQRGRVSCPVLWQSPFLLSEGVRPRQGNGPLAYAYALAVGDVNGDGHPEIVTGTSEYGLLPNEEKPATGRLHVFGFDGQGDFTDAWRSDWTHQATMGTGLDAGDLDGDGAAEVVYRGRDVYGRDPATGGLARRASLDPTAEDGVIASLGEIREPAAATRIVPIYWSLANGQITDGQSADVTVTLLNVWAEAKDVTVTVVSPDADLVVTGGPLRLPSIATGATATLPAFTLRAGGGQALHTVNLEITAAGGYRQTVPARVIVAPAPPTYQSADIGARIATALAQAKAENRRVLLQWGSNEDEASRALIQAAAKDRDVSQKLLYEYEVVRIEALAGKKLAATYRADLKTLPSFTILDAAGTVLANQAAGAFKTADPPGYDGKRLTEFLTKHQAAYLNADTVFNEALSRAKKEQKTLFVWFSAPW